MKTLMSLDDRFKALAEEEPPSFRPIVDAMFYDRKNVESRYLCAMNNIVDWCLSRELTNERINLQVIHVPYCPAWAREMLVRFLIHKMAFTSNRTIIDIFKHEASRPLTLSAEISKRKDIKQARDRYQYRKAISKSFSGIDIPYNNHKSLFLVKVQDVKALYKDPWVKDLFTERMEDDRYNVVVSTDSSDFVETRISAIEDSESIPVIENVFIFHSSNRSNIVNYYNIDQLKRLNQYGLGVKNCIVFYFSDEHQGLYHTIENIKNRLATGLLKRQVRSYDEFDGFITFTSHEVDFLFHRQRDQYRYIIDCQDRPYFSIEVDSVLEQGPHNLKYKNALALAFSEELQNQFRDDVLKEIPDVKCDTFSDFFRLLEQVWDDDIRKKIELFLAESPQAAFIIPRETPETTRRALQSLFENCQIHFYSLEELKNGIEEDRIVVLQYRYTDKLYKSFPNSFDQLPVENHQWTLTLINLLTHNDYHEWNRFRYNRDHNGLLYSLFRKERLGWSKKDYQRPFTPDIKDYIDEAEIDSREYTAEKCIIQYVGGKQREYSSCERVLYKQDGEYLVVEIKALALRETFELQVLDELAEQVKSLISKKTEGNSNSEKIIRSDQRHGLSEEQINSSVELWRILLRRRVDEIGIVKVHEEIVDRGSSISLNGLERWANFDAPMILPRSRKDQRILLTLLGFELGYPYHRIVLAKKMFSINHSRVLNSQIAKLLQHILTRGKAVDMESLMDAHSDILTLLEVSCIDDIDALISLLEVELKPAIRIS